MRRLAAALLGIAIALIIIALAISDWRNGMAFGGSSYDKEAMIAVTFLIIIGLICLLIVFILDMVMLCQTAVPAGTITARFVILYIGVALITIGVLVFTARRGGLWPYFLVVVGAVFAILVAILAAVSSKCVSRERVVVVRSTR
uniref:MARVEL domain-containing protein n=1 Tax=Mesocestoides corti TaxID=53468 RepID=A0A5K3EJY7_MESCO